MKELGLIFIKESISYDIFFGAMRMAFHCSLLPRRYVHYCFRFLFGALHTRVPQKLEKMRVNSRDSSRDCQLARAFINYVGGQQEGRKWDNIGQKWYKLVK